jgi:hypothetical protein
MQLNFDSKEQVFEKRKFNRVKKREDARQASLFDALGDHKWKLEDGNAEAFQEWLDSEPMEYDLDFQNKKVLNMLDLDF